ncbi:MAG: flavodoxin family protein [Clostridiales bacterium]|nr:flavodoxin family protein [Clostridiales bacterium]
MKTLLINGSPRGEKSGTLRLARALCEGLGGGAEEVVLADADIKPCRGCFSCWGETAGKCVISDGMEEILEKILSADTIIESYPLYFCGMTGIMKTFADRILPLTLPYMGKPMPGSGRAFVRLRYGDLMKKKKLVVISTCGYGETGGMFDSLREQYDAVCGKDGYIGLFVPQGELLKIDALEPQIRRHLKKFTEAGRELASTRDISRETRRLLSEPMLPARAYEYIALARWGNAGQ